MKVVGTKLTHFYYNGEILAGQKSGNNVIIFMYDNNGDVFGFTYKDVDYYYVKNAQNDVTAIADSNGNVIANYYYDSWGKCIEVTGNTEIAEINPIRYRSYYYDNETGWYYLKTRYYSPEMCRFINADSVVSGTGESIHGYNMFAYCFNNPVNLDDSNGNWPKWVEKAAKNAVNAVKKAVNVVANIVKSTKASSIVNHVSKSHVTTPTAMLDLGTLVGKVGFSTTVTKQNKKPALLHSSSDIGNDAAKYSAGLNIAGWLGADVGVSSEINAFANAQITPWVHGELSVGLDGLGASIGFDVGDTSFDFEITGGWGLIVIFVAPQLVTIAGEPGLAPA